MPGNQSRGGITAKPNGVSTHLPGPYSRVPQARAARGGMLEGRAMLLFRLRFFVVVNPVRYGFGLALLRVNKKMRARFVLDSVLGRG